MKVLLVTLLFAGAAFAAVIQGNTLGEGPRCPIADPLTVDAGAINVSITAPIFEIFEGSRHEGGVANGLGNGLYYSYTINVLTLSFDVSATITADIAGEAYNAEGTIDASPFTAAVVPSGPMSGAGAYSGEIVDGKIEATGSILVDLISNKISLWAMEITEISFTKLAAFAGGLVIGDVTIDFEDWNANIKANFDAEWQIHGKDFTDRVRKEVLNTYLGQYTLAEFLEIIGETGTAAPCPTPATQF